MNVVKRLLAKEMECTHSGKLTCSYYDGKIKYLSLYIPFMIPTVEFDYSDVDDGQIKLSKLMDTWAKEKYHGKIHLIWEGEKLVVLQEQTFFADDFDEKLFRAQKKKVDSNVRRYPPLRRGYSDINEKKNR